jgi:hypothetical protein
VTEQPGTWRTFGERTVYDNRWVRLGLVDVEAPNGQRWDYHVVHLARIAIAVYLWREFEQVGEPTDAEEAGRVEWVPLVRVTELAARGELLGAGTLVPLLYFIASRGALSGGQHEAGEAS